MPGAGVFPCPAPHVPDHTLIRCIGRGAYGEVWLARNTVGTGRAVKIVYRARFETDRPYEREFEGLRKYEPVSRTHPGLIPILQIGRNDAAGYFYCVMELADPLDPGETGQGKGSMENGAVDRYAPKTLDRLVRQRGRLPAAECIELGLRLSAALGHLHASQLVHRDIKPSNILFVGGCPRLADVGLVTDAGEHASLVGTQGFVSPEGAGSVRGDIFSLGRVLYTIAVGKAAERFPEPVTNLAEASERSFLQEWNEVVLRACEPDPARRYPTAAALHRDLLLLQAGESLGRRRAVERMLRRKARLAVAVALVATVGAVTLFLVLREREHRLRAELIAARDRARAAATEARLNAENAAVSRDLVAREVERLFAEDRSAEAIGQLTRLLRKNPGDTNAIQRLMSALGHRSFGLPAAPLMRHQDEVDVARFDGSGQRLVTASRDGTARVWDAGTGAPLSPPMRHAGRVRWAEFSPDGERIVTASDDGTARLWEAATGRELTGAAEVPAGGAVLMVRFSPDGRRFVTASADGSARLWDGTTGRAAGPPLVHAAKVNTAEFSPDGTRVVTACNDGSARFWAVESGEPVAAEVPGKAGSPLVLWHPSPVNAAVFSPEGGRVVTAGSDGKARVWDARTGAAVGEAMTHRDGVQTVEFSPDGLRVTTASWDRTARIWEAATGVPLTPPLRHGDRLRAARFSPDGLRVATVSADRTVRVWDALTGEPLTEPMYHDDRACWVEFSPDGITLASTSEDGTARIWDVRPGRELGELLPVAMYGAGEFSRDGSWVGIPGNQVWLLTAGADGWSQARALRPGAPGDEAKARLVRFSPDGAVLLATLDGGRAQLWDLPTGGKLGKPLDHDGWITAAAFSPDSRWVVTASFDHTARVWNARSGAPLTGPLSHEHEVWAAEFSPDGRRVLTASLDGTARIWDAVTGQPAAPPLVHARQVQAATFSPDGRWAATACNDQKARVWDVATGRVLGEPLRHGASVNAVRFSPDGSRLVTVTEGGAAWVWDVQRGRLVAGPFRHAGEIASAAFSPEGGRVLTASADGTARVWDAGMGHPLGDPWRHAAALVGARFSPDGRSVLASSVTVLGPFPVLWRMEPFPSPVPRWVLELAEALTLPVEQDGDGPGAASWERMRSLRDECVGSGGDDAYPRWGRWFFADRSRRTISPFSPVSVEAYLDLRSRERRFSALVEVLRIQPTNRFVLGRGFGYFHPPPPAQADGRMRFGERGYALLEAALGREVLRRAERDPEDPVHLWAALNFWRKEGRLADGFAWIDQALPRDPGPVNSCIARAALLEMFHQEAGARRWYEEALQWTRRSTETPARMRERMLIRRGRILNRLGLSEEARADYRTEWNIPSRDPETGSAAIDLSAWYNRTFQDVPLLGYAAGAGLDDLGCIPPGRHLIDGVEFDARGVIQAWSAESQPESYPVRVEGIRVGGRHRRLHFLHAAQHEMSPGEAVGRYRVHYEDGGSIEVPIVYGTDLLWWMMGPPEAEAPSQATVRTMGRNAAGFPVHLFHRAWDNPRPGVAIEALSLEAGRGHAQPMLVALTVE